MGEQVADDAGHRDEPGEGEAAPRAGGGGAPAAASSAPGGLALPGFVSVAGAVRDLFPHRVVNAAIYVSPTWIGTSELGFVLVGVLTALVWAGFECRRALRACPFSYQHPIRRDED